jgi:hypothetical protein
MINRFIDEEIKGLLLKSQILLLKIFDFTVLTVVEESVEYILL